MLIDLKVNDYSDNKTDPEGKYFFMETQRYLTMRIQAQEKNCHLNIVIEGGSKTNYFHLFKSEIMNSKDKWPCILETVGR